jgi:hypothetical protein
MATLNLPDASLTVLWRLIVDRLRRDPVLSDQIATWLIWEGSGSNQDSAELATVGAPALRLTPSIGRHSWYDNERIQRPLVVLMEAYLSTTDVEDVLNLQGALETALVPIDPAEAESFQQTLKDAGALNGMFEFDDPLGIEQERQLKSLVGQTGFAPLGNFRLETVKRMIITP